jgi:hypothetical protein
LVKQSGNRRMHPARTHEVVAEGCSRLATRVLSVALSLVIAAPPSLAQQLPTGGSVAAGSVSIGAPQNGTLNINQSSNQSHHQLEYLFGRHRQHRQFQPAECSGSDAEPRH